MGYSLLVVEDDSTPTEASVQAALGLDSVFSLRRLSWDAACPEALARKGPHAVVAVAVPHNPQVTKVFEWLRDHPIRTPTLAVLPADTSEPLLRSAGQVADDFLLAPLRGGELRQRLGHMLEPSAEVKAVRERLLDEMGLTPLVGKDPVFLRAIEKVPRFAHSDMPVLITGETGTGKELCARAIHFLSKRSSFPFIAVDCGALPNDLIENELFGHARGAYTDAHRDQRGLITMAEGGTLFLDEIDALPPPAQGKLLRFLQERSFRPLGSDRFQQADVNVFAATNRDLEAAVGTKHFRADLFYRLNVLRLHLPPLRERLRDVELLASHFLIESGAAADFTAHSFSARALRTLALYHWPGNVRELANVVHRAVVACEGPQILPCHLALTGVAAGTETPPADFRAGRAAAVAAFERRYVDDLLHKHLGNVTHAAREARKDRRAFGRLIKKYGIESNHSKQGG
jgi:two-component system response regulator GlrR